MSQVKFAEKLYHGSISEISRIDVTKGRGRKDFGKGFYAAVDRNQAIGMMHKKYKESIRRSRNQHTFTANEVLYEIAVDTAYAATLKTKVFASADREWLDFVLKCREDGGTPHDYDLVIGPTADDDTMLCLRSYWDGFYGKVGSASAREILLSNLEPDNLGIQYFVHKQEVADRLFISIRSIDWSEND